MVAMVRSFLEFICEKKVEFEDFFENKNWLLYFRGKIR